MSDDDRLSDYLIGDGGVYGHAGLLDRVKDRVKGLDTDAGPTFATGSIIGAKDNVYADSESETAILELTVALIAWKGGNQPSATTERALVQYLKQYRISDTDLLLGSQRTGEGLIDRTKDRVRSLLHVEVPSAKALGACYGLVELLQAWIDRSCDHDFQPIPSDDPRIQAAKCAICDLVAFPELSPIAPGRTG